MYFPCSLFLCLCIFSKKLFLCLQWDVSGRGVQSVGWRVAMETHVQKLRCHGDVISTWPGSFLGDVVEKGCLDISWRKTGCVHVKWKHVWSWPEGLSSNGTHQGFYVRLPGRQNWVMEKIWVILDYPGWSWIPVTWRSWLWIQWMLISVPGLVMATSQPKRLLLLA